MKEIFLKDAWEWRFVIAMVLLVALYALLEWNNFKAKSYALMLQAKRLAKNAVLKSGDQQADWVVKRAYQFLPKYITIFISEELMKKIVFDLYHQSKDYLDDGKMNNSIK